MSELDVHSASNHFGIDPNLLLKPNDAGSDGLFGKHGITHQEHERRFEQANYVLCSVGLEGLFVSDRMRTILVDYIAGNLSADELDSALCGLTGIKP